MEPKYILDKSSVGTRVGGVDVKYRSGRSVLRDTKVSVVENGSLMPAFTHGSVLYKFAMEGSSAAEVKNERTSSKANGLSPGGRILQDIEKVSVIQTYLVCVIAVRTTCALE